MITGIYFLLLLIASVEDYKGHTVNRYPVLLLWLLGLVKMVLVQENRWVTVALTCICFVFLWIVYRLVCYLAKKKKVPWHFGGADVRMIPAMMLVQGWDRALQGIFLGFLAALLYYPVTKQIRKEIPLVPWMAAGCFVVEIIYFFFGKSVL